MPIDPDIKKELDAVVGERYAPPRRWRETILRWSVAAVLAVGAAAAVITVLHVHVKQAQVEAASKATVPGRIVPAK